MEAMQERIRHLVIRSLMVLVIVSSTGAAAVESGADLAGRDPAWFTGAVAAQLLSHLRGYQTPEGGWCKGYDVRTPRAVAASMVHDALPEARRPLLVGLIERGLDDDSAWVRLSAVIDWCAMGRALPDLEARLEAILRQADRDLASRFFPSLDGLDPDGSLRHRLMLRLREHLPIDVLAEYERWRAPGAL